MLNLSELKSFVIVSLFLTFTLSTFAQLNSCHCFQVRAGWSSSAGGPVTIPFNAIGWDYCSVQQYHYRMGGCGYAYPADNGGFTFAVIDNRNGRDSVWTSHNRPGTNYGQFDNYHCGTTANDQNGFDFGIVGNGPQLIDSFLDQIPDSCIILMYTVSKPPYASLWAQDSDLVNRLASMGATDLRLLCDSTAPGHLTSAPYIFATQKGNPNWHGQTVGHSYDSVLVANFCFDTARVVTATGITTINEAPNFHIYPNPSNADKRFYISTSQGGDIAFYDAIGRIVYEQKLTHGENLFTVGTEDKVLIYQARLLDGSRVSGKLILTR